MKKTTFKVLLSSLAVFAALNFSLATQALGLTNVAYGADVQLNGDFYALSTSGEVIWGAGTGYLPPVNAPASSLVDNQFLSEGTQWDIGTVWWDYHNVSKQSIVLNLNKTYKINSFIMQADNNDEYEIYYKDLNDNSWKLVWDVPMVSGWGMQTRIGEELSQEVKTNALKIMGSSSDLYYSVSEIQAFGTPAPEPSSMVLGLMSLGGLLGFKRKNKSRSY